MFSLEPLTVGRCGYPDLLATVSSATVRKFTTASIRTTS
jgi:hypothetical protein